MKVFNFVLIGRSGAGKGTQAELLQKHFGNLFYISSGDLFRDLIKQDTDTAKRIKKILKEGGLPFDELAIALWMHKIAYNVKENQGFILDGAPRRIDEAKALDRFLDFLERKERTFFLLIDVSKEEAFNRLLKRRVCSRCGRVIPAIGKFKNLKICDRCGGRLISRPDDTPEAINKRLDYYEKNVIEVVKFYQKDDRLIRINGQQSIEDVFKEILKKIQPKIRNYL